MTSINYNEFQAGQGVSAPALNENFSLTNNAIENLEVTVNSAITSLNSTANLKANKNGSNAESFNVANATENSHAVNLEQINSLLTPLSPTGSIIWYAGASVPEGYLLCNGSNVSRTTYSQLFKVIGVKYGAGDSTTTFGLPKLTDNRFIEGAASVGTYKNAGLPNITGSFNSDLLTDGRISAKGAFTTGSDWTYSTPDTGGDGSQSGFSFNASKSSSIYGNSSTVQPKSLTLLPCIKY